MTLPAAALARGRNKARRTLPRATNDTYHDPSTARVGREGSLAYPCHLSTMLETTTASQRKPPGLSFRGVHHLALNTDDMKSTLEFYTEVLGMSLAHAMKVPPGLGTGPNNRGNPPYENIRHYLFDMGNDSVLAFFEIPKGAQGHCDRND